MENEWIEKLAIQELCARYAHAIDGLDPEAWVQCFTTDGEFQIGPWVIKGHAALREFAKVHVREIRPRHLAINFLYEVHGDKATGCASTVATLATPNGFKVFGQGRYVDRMVKQGGQWRIAYRLVDIDTTASEPTKSPAMADPDIAALLQPLFEAVSRLGKKVEE